VLLILPCYGRLRRISNPTMAIAMIMAIAAPTMYHSKGGNICSPAVGVGDAFASKTPNAVCAKDA
jgi:hypothetical protein